MVWISNALGCAARPTNRTELLPRGAVMAPTRASSKWTPERLSCAIWASQSTIYGRERNLDRNDESEGARTIFLSRTDGLEADKGKTRPEMTLRKVFT